jgi:hypothetical protein
MNKLIQAVEMIRQKLPKLRRESLKEYSTRTIVIDFLLEALGWDVRDPDEVCLEYPTIDGKSVDYALLINKKPVLLVEAKALNDPLDDVKAITQVVGYAANDGIVWCLLTNGIKWRMYRSMEKCPAPDKLMFEVNLDPGASEDMTVAQIARQLWRFSREEMAKGTLDALGEQTFTDGKVRKALQTLLTDPPKGFLNLVRKATRDESLTSQRVRDSLARIAGETSGGGNFMPPIRSETPDTDAPAKLTRSREARVHPQAICKKTAKGHLDESHHISGRPREAVALYRAVDQLCYSMRLSGITRQFFKKTINYYYETRCFCSVHVLRSGLRIWLPLKYNQIKNPPDFVRDVSQIGHWGIGDLELRIINHADLDASRHLIQQAYETVKTSK